MDLNRNNGVTFGEFHQSNASREVCLNRAFQVCTYFETTNSDHNPRALAVHQPAS